MADLQLTPAVVVRHRRNLIVETPELGSARFVLPDPTGDVELLLELLAGGGLDRTGIIQEFTSKREGAEPMAVSAALDALEELGLIVASHSGLSEDLAHLDPGQYLGTFSVTALGPRP